MTDRSAYRLIGYMSAPAPHYGCPVEPVVARLHADTPRQVAPPTGAANDPAQLAPEANDYRNPLWMIAFATACLFAVMALLLALG